MSPCQFSCQRASSHAEYAVEYRTHSHHDMKPVVMEQIWLEWNQTNFRRYDIGAYVINMRATVVSIGYSHQHATHSYHF